MPTPDASPWFQFWALILAASERLRAAERDADFEGDAADAEANDQT